MLHHGEKLRSEGDRVLQESEHGINCAICEWRYNRVDCEALRTLKMERTIPLIPGVILTVHWSASFEIIFLCSWLNIHSYLVWYMDQYML